MNIARLRRFSLILAGLFIVLAGLAILGCSPFGLGLALRTQGLQLSSSGLRIGLQRLTGSHIVITSSRGEPVFSADALDVRYDLRSLIQGGPHAFGIVAVTLHHPVVTVIRRSDGSWNIPGLSGNGNTNTPSRSATDILPPHLRFAVVVEDGRLEIDQPMLLDRSARTMTLDHLTLAAAVDSDHFSTYRLHGEIMHQPILAQGAIDADSGVALHRLRIAHMPIAALINTIVDSDVFTVQSGDIDHLALTVSGNGKRGQAIVGDQIAGQADIAHFSARLTGLAQPLQNIHGNLDVTNDAVSFAQAHGRIATMPFTASGAIFDFSLPQLQISAEGSGSLETMRSLFSFSKDLPIRGRVSPHITVEGPATSPLVLVHLGTAQMQYGSMPVTLQGGTVAYYDSGVDLAPINLQYGPVDIAAGGAIALEDHVLPQIVVDATTPSARFPYLDTVFGGTTNALVVLSGQDTALDGWGVIEGHDGLRRLRGLAHLNGQGEGIIGPLALDEPGHTRMLAGGALVRPKNTFLGVILADHAAMSTEHAALPGLDLPALPPLAATLQGTLALTGDYHSFQLSGIAHADQLLYAGHPIADTADLSLSGDLRLLTIDQADAQGTFGRLQATGFAGTSGAQLQAALDARLGALGKLFGYGDMTGHVHVPIDVTSDGHAVAVDVHDAGFSKVRVAGIPVQSLNGHVALDGHRVAVDAQIGVSGGQVLAGGDLVRGLGVSFEGLHGTGAFAQTTLGGAALLQGNGEQAHGHGVASVQNVLIDGLPVMASGLFDADMRNVALNDVFIQAPGLLADLDGSIKQIDLGGVLDLHGDIVDASVATLAQHFAPQSLALDPNGWVTGSLQVLGTLRTPRLTGVLGLPEGSINGLAFSDAQMQIDATPQLIRLHHGRVIVGSTQVRLGGAYDGQNFRSYLNAPKANLADFNDFFDQNDMLAGTGRVRVNAALGGNAIRTLADVDLQHVRLSSFDLGTTQAHWHSQGREINGALDVDGKSGKISIIGGLQLAAKRPMVHLLSRSRLNLNGSARDLDLERWLPALGVTAPVTGRLDIAGRAVGSVPKLTADLTVDAYGATIGPVPISDARAHLVARNGRGVLDSAHVVVHGAVADANGSFGFSATDPIAIALHAQAPDIGDLVSSVVQTLHNDRATQVLAMLKPIDGAASTSLSIQGSMEKPRYLGALDIEAAHLHGVSLPRVVASFGLEGKKLDITDAEVAFAKGQVTAVGALPLILSPFAIGPGNAPLSLNLSADALNVSSFTPLLPAKSQLQGIIDGAIALEGTPDSPQLFGELDLGAASFVSPLESVPIREAHSTLQLSGRSANVNAGATVGGGLFALNGKASVENLTALGHHTDYSLHALAKHATVDVANFGHGTLDADVRVSHYDDGVPHVDGNVALSDAQIPFSVFYNPNATTPSVTNSLFAETALNVQLVAGKNTRIRSGSVDIGATGSALLGGTIAQPTLDGAFTSNGGSLAYVNHLFHVASGRVAFDPADGIDPQISASATTTTQDPDTNTTYNTSGHVTITLHVAGTLEHLNVDLTSDPAYDRQQILGLLLDAPLLGAVRFNQSTGPNSQVNNGLNLPTANTNTGQVSVSQEAFGLVNAQFSQSLLAPISSALGGAVGLSDLAVDFGQSGGFDFSARRHISGNVYAFFTDSIGVPTSQSLGIDFEPNDATAVSVSIFQEQGLSTLGRVSTASLFTPQQTLSETASSASGGATTSGVSFSLNRRFP